MRLQYSGELLSGHLFYGLLAVYTRIVHQYIDTVLIFEYLVYDYAYFTSIAHVSLIITYFIRYIRIIGGVLFPLAAGQHYNLCARCYHAAGHGQSKSRCAACYECGFTL